jgi:hypothetical protein
MQNALATVGADCAESPKAGRLKCTVNAKPALAKSTEQLPKKETADGSSD